MEKNAVAIKANKLEKRYGPIQAVKGIDLEIGWGELFSLLGPNGAGKTTAAIFLFRRRMVLG